MRKFWMNSLPLIAVFLVVAFGFTLAAHAADCEAMKAAAEEMTAAAGAVCGAFGNDSGACISAQAAAGAAWASYYEQCS